MKLYPNITKFFFIWLILILIIFSLGFLLFPHSEKFNNNFWESLANWDGGHFLGIAQKGISVKFQYAFFPVYPFLIKIVNLFIGNYLWSGILISLFSAFFGLQILYKLVFDDFGKKIAEKTVIAFLIFPTSFFLLTVYSEGLFFFFVVAAFYFLKKNKLFLVTVLTALASGTRLVGLALIIAIWLQVWGKQGFNKKNWYLIFAPSGFLIYCLFLFSQTGDFLYFISAQNHWQRILAVPGTGFLETFRDFPGSGFDLLFAIFGLGFAVRCFRFLPLSYSVYALLGVLMPLLTSTLSSIPRFLLPIFPIFILVALLKNKYVVFGIQFISIILLIYFSVLFINGYWVA